jgi:hypothetical protein
MPLKKGRSRKVVSENIREFHAGKTYAHTAEKFGKDVANKQAIAVALNTAGKSRRKKKAKKRKQGGRA